MDWRISPLFTPIDGLLMLPQTYIYVSEHDVLHDDGVLMYKQMIDIGHTGTRSKLGYEIFGKNWGLSFIRTP